MDLTKYSNILNGHFNKLPKPRSKVVRIFLSSTFSDYHAERDYLLAEVYPKLKAYCKIAYGLDFQVLDMRWGISHEITNSHTTTSICLNEITNCQRNSAGPFFIGLLSHRYGCRSLPERILEEEYETMKLTLKQSADDYDLAFKYESHENSDADLDIKDIFEFCYELDKNEHPARYRLIRLDKAFAKFNPKDSVFEKVWNKLEIKLGNLLRSLAKLCFEKGQFTVTQYERFLVSVTEKEIFKGVLTAKNQENNVLFFQREIIDIEAKFEEAKLNNKNLSLFKRFIDIDKNEIDQEVKSLVTELKNRKVPSVLASQNIFEFDVNWSDSEGISFKTHEKYLQDFGELFYERVKYLIDKNQKETKNIFRLDHPVDEQLLREVLDHAYFCNETADKFRGRSEILDKVKEFVLKESGPRSLVVYGNSGCGKTAIMAKITKEIMKYVPDPENYTVILRFLGTTPASSCMQKVLRSLICQLARIFAFTVPKMHTSSVRELGDLLRAYFKKINDLNSNQKILILLDSIDQLTPEDYRLDWLIENPPNNVKFIYSTLPDHGYILRNFRSRLNENMIEIQVGAFNIDLATTMLEELLKKSNRRLSQSQWNVIKNQMFSHAELFPLYITIVFDIVSKLASFDEIDVEFTVCLQIDTSIEYLFKYLQKVHGTLLFAHAITYFTMFQNGISENEIEDILSLDDEVLYEVFEFHAPPMRRLPSALWSRIKHDLSYYIVEKEANETRVIYWYHRRFIEVASNFYLASLAQDQRDDIVSNVIDYYNETWKNKPKPYKYNEYLAKKKNNGSIEAAEKRETTLQPTVLVDEQGNVRYNVRKITELPKFISRLNANLSLELACQNVYFDYYFLIGLFKFLSFTEIIQDFQETTKPFVDGSFQFSASNEAFKAGQELSLMSLLIMQCGLDISEHPESAIVQILSRSLKLYGYTKYFSRLIDQYYQVVSSSTTPQLLVPYQNLNVPGNGHIFEICKHTEPITHAVLGGNQNEFTFTLSCNKVHLLVLGKSFNSFDLPFASGSTYEDDQEPPSFFIVKPKTEITDRDTSVQNLSGLILLATSHTMIAYSFSLNSALKIHYKLTFDQSVLEIYQISSSHVVIFFKEQPYFDIYDMDQGSFLQRQELKSPVTMVKCNYDRSNLHKYDNSEPAYLMIAFITHEIGIATVIKKQSSTETTYHVEIVTLPYSGFPIHSISYVQNRKLHEVIVTFKSTSVLLSFTFYNEELASKATFQCMRPRSQYMRKRLVQNGGLKFLSRDNDTVVYLGEKNKTLYLVDTSLNFKIIEIKGKFDNGFMLGKELAIGVNQGVFKCILVNIYGSETDLLNGYGQYQTWPIADLTAHYDDIIRIMIENQVCLTVSKDSSIKAFAFGSIEYLEMHNFQFDKSISPISSIIFYKPNMTLTTSHESNIIDLWDLKTGKIVNTLKLSKTEKIVQIVCTNENLVVASIDTQYENKWIIRGYNIKIENVKSWRFFGEQFRLESSSLGSLPKVFAESHQDDDVNFRLIFGSNEPLGLVEYCFSFTRLKGQISLGDLDKLACKHVTKSEIFNWPFDRKICCQNLSLTDKSGYLITTFNDWLCFVKNGRIVAKESIYQSKIDMDYFLSMTHLSRSAFLRIETVLGTDMAIGIDNLNHLVVIGLNENNISQPTVSLKLIRDEKNSPIEFQSFYLTPNMITSFAKKERRLLVLNLKKLIRNNFQVCSKVIQFETRVSEENRLSKYTLSFNEKYLFTIENGKTFKFFELHGESGQGGQVFATRLYSRVTCDQIMCSDEFVCLAMQDNRILPLMIIDNKMFPRDLPVKVKDFAIEDKIKHLFDENSRGQMNMMINRRDSLLVRFEDMQKSKKEVDNKIYDTINKRMTYSKWSQLDKKPINKVKLKANWIAKLWRNEKPVELENEKNEGQSSDQELESLDKQIVSIPSEIKPPETDDVDLKFRNMPRIKSARPVSSKACNLQ